MKKIILSSMMIAFGIAAQAQSNVTLNVKLNPIQTLVVNPAQKTVDLAYHTKEDYASGVSSGKLADHLTVFSTGGFAVSVQASGSKLVSEAAGSNGNIAANSIQIIPFYTEAATDGVVTTVALSENNQTILTSTFGAVDKTIDIEYKGSGANAYINNYVASQSPTVYTTELTYTIVAQ